MEYLTTVSGWILMLSLATQFLLSLLLWGLGITYVKRYLWVTAEPALTWHVLVVTCVVAIVAGIVMGLWGHYNRTRYGLLHRRHMPEPVSLQELSTHFGIPQETLNQLQSARWVEYDDDVTLLSNP